MTAARGSTTTTFSHTTASLPLGESHAGGTLGGWAVTNTFDANLRRTTVATTLSGAAQFTQGLASCPLQSVFPLHQMCASRKAVGYDTAGRLQSATSGSFSAREIGAWLSNAVGASSPGSFRWPSGLTISRAEAEYAYHANSPLVSTVSHRYGGNNRMVTIKQSDFSNRLGSPANGTGEGMGCGRDGAVHGQHPGQSQLSIVRTAPCMTPAYIY